MNTFKVKAFKQTSTSFEYWIEDPNGKLYHDKFKIIPGSSCHECLAEVLQELRIKFINELSYELATHNKQACDILGNLNSFISRDFQIPKKS